MVFKIIISLIVAGGIVGVYFLGRDHGRDKMSDEIMNAIIKMIGGRDNISFGFTILTPDGDPADYRGELTRIDKRCENFRAYYSDENLTPSMTVKYPEDDE